LEKFGSNPAIVNSGLSLADILLQPVFKQSLVPEFTAI
jgi:hypothetical protein